MTAVIEMSVSVDESNDFSWPEAFVIGCGLIVWSIRPVRPTPFEMVNPRNESLRLAPSIDDYRVASGSVGNHRAAHLKSTHKEAFNPRVEDGHALATTHPLMSLSPLEAQLYGITGPLPVAVTNSQFKPMDACRESNLYLWLGGYFLPSGINPRPHDDTILCIF